MRYFKRFGLCFICIGIVLGGSYLFSKENLSSSIKNSIYPVSVDLSQIDSEYILLEEVQSERVIAQKNSEELIYPASMTKMMTALIALEKLDDLDEVITIPSSIFPYLWEENASVAGFEAYEQVTIRDLVYGVLLPSGADCTLTLAYYIAGDEDAFAQMMNEKAEKLGMSQTHFVNSSGLHDDAQVTTPKDLSKLLRYALSNEKFKEVFTAHEYKTSPTNVHSNGIQLKSSMFHALKEVKVPEGEILGGKTGYTGEAGRCLASYARVDGIEYILISAKATSSSLAHVNDAYNLYSQLANHRLYHLESSHHEINLDFSKEMHNRIKIRIRQ